jgi:DNA-binding NtrC family response regulator
MVMGIPGSILVVEDDEFVGNSLKWLLTDEGYHVSVATDGKQALAVIEQTAFDLVITDLRMPDVDGIEVLRHVKRTSPLTPVIVLTGYGTVDAAVSALEAGAFDFLTKPCDDLEMKFKIINALTMKDLRTQLDALRASSGRDHELIGVMREALELLSRRPDRAAVAEHLCSLAACLDGASPQSDPLDLCRRVLERLRQS